MNRPADALDRIGCLILLMLSAACAGVFGAIVYEWLRMVK